MRMELTTAPTTEPLTVPEAKLHLREDGDDQDNVVAGLIQSAREEAESLTGRKLITQTWTLKLDRFPGSEIRIPILPLISVSSVKYVDDDGVLQTVSTSDYVVDTSGVVPRIYLAYDKSWPDDVRGESNAVRIEIIAGYGAADAVPQKFRSWMLLRIGDLYEHRERVVAGTAFAELPGVDALVLSERVGF